MYRQFAVSVLIAAPIIAGEAARFTAGQPHAAAAHVGTIQTSTPAPANVWPAPSAPPARTQAPPAPAPFEPVAALDPEAQASQAMPALTLHPQDIPSATRKVDEAEQY